MLIPNSTEPRCDDLIVCDCTYVDMHFLIGLIQWIGNLGWQQNDYYKLRSNSMGWDWAAIFHIMTAVVCLMSNMWQHRQQYWKRPSLFTDHTVHVLTTRHHG